jgi:hypothetical protein
MDEKQVTAVVMPAAAPTSLGARGIIVDQETA